MDAAKVATQAFKLVSNTASAAEKSGDLARMVVFVDPSCPQELRTLLQQALMPQTYLVALAIQSTQDPARLAYLAGSDVCLIATAALSQDVASCLSAAQHARVQTLCVGAPLAAFEAELEAAGLAADFDQPETLVLGGEADLSALADWLNLHCDKNQTLAAAFPFMRKPFERQAIMGAAASNALAGALIGKRHDMPAMCLTQLSLAYILASLNGVATVPVLAAQAGMVLVGAKLCRKLARKAQDKLPILGPVIRAGIGFGGTALMGTVFSATDACIRSARQSSSQSPEE